MVSLEDGRGRPVPIDVDPSRNFVYTEDDVVTQIEGVGGGIRAKVHPPQVTR